MRKTNQFLSDLFDGLSASAATSSEWSDGQGNLLAGLMAEDAASLADDLRESRDPAPNLAALRSDVARLEVDADRLGIRDGPALVALSRTALEAVGAAT